MKKTTSLLLAAMVAGSVFSTAAMADANHGKSFYMKKLRYMCKKDGLKNGAVFAIKHSRQEWAAINDSGKIQGEWKSICPSGVKKID